MKEAPLNLFWNRQGQPIELEEFARLFEDPEYRFLRRTQVGDYEVITAWLGIDQEYGSGDLPVIFGTIARAAGVGYLDDSEVCTSTEEDALRAHDEMVRAHG